MSNRDPKTYELYADPIRMELENIRATVAKDELLKYFKTQPAYEVIVDWVCARLGETLAQMRTAPYEELMRLAGAQDAYRRVLNLIETPELRLDKADAASKSKEKL